VGRVTTCNENTIIHEDLPRCFRPAIPSSARGGTDRRKEHGVRIFPAEHHRGCMGRYLWCRSVDGIAVDRASRAAKILGGKVPRIRAGSAAAPPPSATARRGRQLRPLPLRTSRTTSTTPPSSAPGWPFASGLSKARHAGSSNQRHDGSNRHPRALQIDTRRCRQVLHMNSIPSSRWFRKQCCKAIRLVEYLDAMSSYGYPEPVRSEDLLLLSEKAAFQASRFYSYSRVVYTGRRRSYLQRGRPIRVLSASWTSPRDGIGSNTGI